MNNYSIDPLIAPKKRANKDLGAIKINIICKLNGKNEEILETPKDSNLLFLFYLHL